MSRLRVLLCDDHPLVSTAMAALVELHAELELVGQASDGLEALRLARELQPDVILLDLSMPKLDGAQVLNQLQDSDPHLKILVLSGSADETRIRELLEAGASGYLVKSAAIEDLVRAILAVGNGGTYVDGALAGRVFAAMSARRSTAAAPRLSARENEVLRHVAEGLAMKEIAAKLDLSVRTLETYKTRAMEKASLTDRADIVRYALSRGLLRVE